MRNYVWAGHHNRHAVSQAAPAIEREKQQPRRTITLTRSAAPRGAPRRSQLTSRCSEQLVRKRLRVAMHGRGMAMGGRRRHSQPYAEGMGVVARELRGHVACEWVLDVLQVHATHGGYRYSDHLCARESIGTHSARGREPLSLVERDGRGGTIEVTSSRRKRQPARRPGCSVSLRVTQRISERNVVRAPCR